MYTLGVECAWRIRTDNEIIVGSDDYYERDPNTAEESCEPNTPTGHSQNQKLSELFGEIRGDRVINTGSEMLVASVREEPCNGIRIDLTGSHVLEVFPASAGEMEWIFMMPDSSLVLIDGVVNRTSGKRKRGRTQKAWPSRRTC